MASWNTSLVLRNIQAEIDQINYEIAHSGGGIGPQGPAGAQGPVGASGASNFTMQLNGGAQIYNNTINSYIFPSTVPATSLTQYIVSDQSYNNCTTSCQYFKSTNSLFLGLTKNKTPSDPTNPLSSCTYYLYADDVQKRLYLYVNNIQGPYITLTSQLHTFTISAINGILYCYLDNVVLPSFQQTIDPSLVWYSYCSTYNNGAYNDNIVTNYVFNQLAIGPQGIKGDTGATGATGATGPTGATGSPGSGTQIKIGYCSANFVPTDPVFIVNKVTKLGLIQLDGMNYSCVDLLFSSFNITGSITGAVSPYATNMIFYLGIDQNQALDINACTSYSITIPVTSAIPTPFNFNMQNGVIPLSMYAEKVTFDNIYLFCVISNFNTPLFELTVSNINYTCLVKYSNPPLSTELVVS
jgi:hypothetical protein